MTTIKCYSACMFNKKYKCTAENIKVGDFGACETQRVRKK